MGVDGGAGGRDIEVEIDEVLFDTNGDGDGKVDDDDCGGGWEDASDNKEDEAFETVEVEERVETVETADAGGAGASIESSRQLMLCRSTSPIDISMEWR